MIRWPELREVEKTDASSAQPELAEVDATAASLIGRELRAVGTTSALSRAQQTLNEASRYLQFVQFCLRLGTRPTETCDARAA